VRINSQDKPFGKSAENLPDCTGMDQNDLSLRAWFTAAACYLSCYLYAENRLFCRILRAWKTP